jgi:hypothetical protein
MKKRGPRLNAITDQLTLIGIWHAIEGNPSWLARSLRSGTASTAEQMLAADLIEGKLKPRRPRSFESTRERRLEIALDYAFLKKVYAHLPKRARQEKAVKGEIAKLYGVSARHVDNVLAEFDDKELLEIKRIRHGKRSEPYLDRDQLELLFEKFFARK